MLIHLMYDEKIIDGIIENFEVANPGANLFLIYRNKDEGGDFKYIKSKEAKSFHSDKDSIIEILNYHYKAKAIICHILSIDFAKLLLQVDRPIKRFWVIWGYDLYSLPEIKPNLYASITKSILFKKNRLTKVEWLIKRNVYLRKLYYLIVRSQNVPDIIEKAQQTIDYCVTYLKEDYDLFKLAYPNTKAIYFDAAFLNIYQYVGGDFINETVVGSNILIGNSNSIESNHVDVFNFLKDKISKTTKAIVPLSYGNDSHYKNIVLEKGNQLLGESFLPITNFLSLREYIGILKSCGVGIFYHYRQQAMGNIIAMLWLGARVYLSYKNPAYKYFKRIGIIIYDLENEYCKYGNSHISTEERLHNRKVLQSIFSKDIVDQDYSELVREAYR